MPTCNMLYKLVMFFKNDMVNIICRILKPKITVIFSLISIVHVDVQTTFLVTFLYNELRE